MDAKIHETYSYSKIIEAKDKNLVPVCVNSGTNQEIALHSKYNPVREAESFAQNVGVGGSFFVILGISGGYHIEKLLEKFPASKIIAVERDENDINFLFQISLVKKLSCDKRVVFSLLENLEENLLALYKPALHGNLIMLSLRQWENLFPETAETARKKINSAIKLLAQDFSVQSHFGKIWQKNILSNLSLAEKTRNFIDVKKALSSKNQKTAAIIAAGPSLDENIAELKENREKYFVIATDTAFSALTKQGIESDAVVSIDGQEVSHEHFMESGGEKTLYVFDLCASASSVQKILSKTKNVVLAETGHPLSQYASFFEGKENFVHLEAGSGTVTIAAASLAKKLGFSDIRFFGADFAYVGGRPYARGTYLEKKFYSLSNRFSTAEKSYAKIMFRTPVKKIGEGKITTEILEAYRDSLADFMEKDIQARGEPCRNIKPEYDSGSTFNLESFKSRYCKDLQNSFRSENDFDENSPAMTTLLPLCAKLGSGSAFIAYLKTLEYTKRI